MKLPLAILLVAFAPWIAGCIADDPIVGTWVRLSGEPRYLNTVTLAFGRRGDLTQTFEVAGGSDGSIACTGVPLVYFGLAQLNPHGSFTVDGELACSGGPTRCMRGHVVDVAFNCLNGGPGQVPYGTLGYTVSADGDTLTIDYSGYLQTYQRQ